MDGFDFRFCIMVLSLLYLSAIGFYLFRKRSARGRRSNANGFKARKSARIFRRGLGGNSPNKQQVSDTKRSFGLPPALLATLANPPKQPDTATAQPLHFSGLHRHGRLPLPHRSQRTLPCCHLRTLPATAKSTAKFTSQKRPFTESKITPTK